MDPADPTQRYLEVLDNDRIVFDGRSTSVQGMLILPGLGQNVTKIADLPSQAQLFVTSEGDDRVQVGLGVATVMLGVPWWLSALHLANAAALVALLVAATCREALGAADPVAAIGPPRLAGAAS